MKTIQFFLTAVCLLTSCRTEEATSPGNPVYPEVIESRIRQVTDNLQVKGDGNGSYTTSNLTDRMKHFHTPGVSLAVINGGKVEWARGFGVKDDQNHPVDVKTLFEAGSVSKPVFALAVMRLREAGILDIDKKVNDYLVSWKVPGPENRTDLVNLRRLLGHRAGMTVHGFPGYSISATLPTVPQILDGKSPANTEPVRMDTIPGSVFRYSGGGVTIAQLVVTDVLQKPFPEIMAEELFRPLHLEYSTYEQPLPDSLRELASTAYPEKGVAVSGGYHVYPEMAAAGLWTNPTELATILIEAQKALQGQSALFKKETIAEMITPQSVVPDVGISYFLVHNKDKVWFGHNGWDEGFVTSVIASADGQWGAVVMINSNEGNPMLQEIMRSMAKVYHWRGFPAE